MEVRRREQGFTLFEMLIAMGISVTVMAVGLMLYVNGLKSVSTNNAQIAANASARLVMDYIDKDLKQGIMIPDSVTIAQGTFAPSSTVLVISLPGWNNAQSQTLTGITDTVIYQFVTTQTSGGITHKAYNMRRILVPGTGSSRVAEDRWLLPYAASLDATNLALYRSDPRLEITPGNTGIFTYYIQDAAHPGQVTAWTSGTYRPVVLVQTRFTTYKTYENTTLRADVDTQSRMRNWAP